MKTKPNQQKKGTLTLKKINKLIKPLSKLKPGEDVIINDFYKPKPNQQRKEITAQELMMFILMVVFGLKNNKNYPGLGDELEKLFEERFKRKLI